MFNYIKGKDLFFRKWEYVVLVVIGSYFVIMRGISWKSVESLRRCKGFEYLVRVE